MCDPRYLPLHIAGDANVWHPEFSLNRSRSQDDLIVPLVDLLVSSCGLALIDPRGQARHDAGAALDLVFVSADCPSTLRIHDGIGCCAQAPGCCPVMGSDHRLCVVSTQLNCRTTHTVPRGIPHLRDWSSTLLPTSISAMEQRCLFPIEWHCSMCCRKS